MRNKVTDRAVLLNFLKQYCQENNIVCPINDSTISFFFFDDIFRKYHGSRFMVDIILLDLFKTEACSWGTNTDGLKNMANWDLIGGGQDFAVIVNS